MKRRAVHMPMQCGCCVCASILTAACLLPFLPSSSPPKKAADAESEKLKFELEPGDEKALTVEAAVAQEEARKAQEKVRKALEE
eukprot:1258709-Pleurochrysis_carterae.AAC.1